MIYSFYYGIGELLLKNGPKWENILLFSASHGQIDRAMIKKGERKWLFLIGN
jgi:hypothetical protein